MRSVSPGNQSSAHNKFFKSHSSGFGMSDNKSTSVNQSAYRHADLNKINSNISVHGVGTSIKNTNYNHNINIKNTESVQSGKNLNLQNYKNRPGYNMNKFVKENKSKNVFVPKIETDKINKFRN